jgi:Arc/MetJ family transcription regulator
LLFRIDFIMPRSYDKSRVTRSRGQNIRINEFLYARTILAAQEAGQSLAEWTEAALQAALGRHEEDRQRRAYERAKREAEVLGRPSPLVADYIPTKRP